MLDILEYRCYYMQAIEIAHAPVAQLDRVTDYESVGQGFESLPAYQNEHLRVFVLFCFPASGFCCTVGAIQESPADAKATTVINQKTSPGLPHHCEGRQARGNPVVHRTSRIIDGIATGYALAMTWWISAGPPIIIGRSSWLVGVGSAARPTL